VNAGTTVDVAVTIHDASILADVQCQVSGATTFGFPDLHPSDSTLSATFPVPTVRGRTGRVVVSVNATDALGNASAKSFAFVVR